MSMKGIFGFARQVVARQVACGGIAGIALAACIGLAAAQEPRPDLDATLKIAHQVPPASLDPHMQFALAEGTYSNLIYDRLTMFGPDRKPHPMLATSWTFAADGSYLELKLRDDVTFHDGTRFDAQAVKANIERAKNLPRSTAAPLLSTVTSVEPVSDFVVRLHLTPRSGAILPYYLATGAGAMISPKAIADTARDLALNPGNAGSGPFIASSFTPREIVVYERAPQPHWDKSLKLPKRIEISFLSPGASFRSIQTGAVDVALILGAEIQPGKAWVGANSANYEYQQYAAGGGALYLRPTQPLVSDLRVRRAIGAAIDRPALARAVYGDACEPLTQLFPSTEEAYDPDYVDVKYDPEWARSEIEKAGATGAKLEILSVANSHFEKSALIVQSMLKEVGLEATVNSVAMTDAVGRFRAGDRQALMFAVLTDAHPLLTFESFITSGFSLMPADKMPEIEALLAKTKDPLTSDADRLALLRQATRMAGDQALLIRMCNSGQLVINSKKVMNAKSIYDTIVGAIRDFRFMWVASR